MSNHLLLSKASDGCELNSHETLSEQSKGMIWSLVEGNLKGYIWSVTCY